MSGTGGVRVDRKDHKSPPDSHYNSLLDTKSRMTRARREQRSNRKKLEAAAAAKTWREDNVVHWWSGSTETGGPVSMAPLAKPGSNRI
jgi:hypothetical protein